MKEAESSIKERLDLLERDGSRDMAEKQFVESMDGHQTIGNAWNGMENCDVNN